MPRFFTLLIPAMLGSLAVSSWLNTPSMASAPLNSANRPLAPVMAAARSEHAQPATAHPIQNSVHLLPTLESLDGMFGPGGEQTESDPDTLPLPNDTNTELSPLEIQVNETLLAALDPYLLSREQKQLFARSIPTGYPLSFRGITSPFGFRIHPTLHTQRFHPGVDLQAPMHTLVTATADGVVEFSGVDTGKLGLNGLGQVISIHHNYGFTTTYSHLSKLHVKAGDFVKKGDLIALTGNSGIVTAPHLHYEIRFIHHYLNPAPFLEWTPEQYERLFREKNVKWMALIELLGMPSVTTQTARVMTPGTVSAGTPK
ncbi:MAG: M23 family metallopeptidase [Magnetococcales bacterium]|nr:M23 family metallopeptidase [Magnetococcales bacterium]NGZ06789.1 M23 family metallopeptidase [Magnetococcales bacterium]